jgi:MFS family permease
MEEQNREATTEWAAIAGVIATVSVFAIAQGLTYPLLSFILQRQGVSPSLIGLSAAMTPIGFIVSSPVIPALARRFGAGRTALSCAAISVLLLSLIGWTQDANAWFVLRFLLGVATNPLYVLSETWMIALAPPARRGRIMGIYSTVISAGFATGPLCLLLVGSEGWPPFLVGIVAFVICGVCLASVLHRLPGFDHSGVQVSVLGFLPLA